MKVMKFGGTSVGTVESLKNVKSIVDSCHTPVVVVVSALGGLTDKLIYTANLASSGDTQFKNCIKEMADRHFHIINTLVPLQKRGDVLHSVGELLGLLEDIYTGISLIRDLPDRTLAQIVSFGERMSSIIVANILDDAVHKDSLEFIKTEKWFDKNIADRDLTDRLIKESFSGMEAGAVVCGGFISKDRDTGEITNLGRGGSDYTAALIAAALDADTLEIWTDVDGFMTADPRVIKDARVIDRMTFIESMELCSFGAKVIYPPTIYPVFHKNIPIRILNTHNPSAKGTLIVDSADNLPECVRGVSAVKNSAMITIKGRSAGNIAEINSRTYNAMARNGISVLSVSQINGAEAFSVSIPESEADKATRIVKDEFAPELQNGELESVSVDKGLTVIAVVRESIKKLVGLGARILDTLRREGIDVLAITDGSSETTIALVVRSEESQRALSLVHEICYAG